MPTLVASSPKLRALQTARLFQAHCKPRPALEEWPALAGDDVWGWLSLLRLTGAASVVLVGHEPQLGRFASVLLTLDVNTLPIAWKKAGALGIALDVASGRGQLLWMLSPRLLRALG